MKWNNNNNKKESGLQKKTPRLEGEVFFVKGVLASECTEGVRNYSQKFQDFFRHVIVLLAESMQELHLCLLLIEFIFFLFFG